MSQTVDQQRRSTPSTDDDAPAAADASTLRRWLRLPWRKTVSAGDDADCVAKSDGDQPGGDGDDGGDGEDPDAPDAATPGPTRRLVAFIALIVVVTMAVLCGWLGVRGSEVSQQLREREAFVHAAREGAVMLTTIDAAHVQDDVARIVGSSTGRFLEDFQLRSKGFVDTVVKVQSKTEGTVLAAGLQSVEGDQADVLVTMSVKTSINGAETQPRQWRMRIGVQRDGSTVKVSNVEFVP